MFVSIIILIFFVPVAILITKEFYKEKEINDKYNIMDSKIFMKLYEKSIFNKIKKFNKKVYLTFDFLDENNFCQYIKYSYIVDGLEKFGGKFKRGDLDKLLYISGLIDINPKIIIDYINNDIKDTYFNKDLYFKLFDLLNIKNKKDIKELKKIIKNMNETLKKGKKLNKIKLNNKNYLDLKELFSKQKNNKNLKNKKINKGEGKGKGDGKIGEKKDLKVYIK